MLRTLQLQGTGCIKLLDSGIRPALQPANTVCGHSHIVDRCYIWLPPPPQISVPTR